MADASKEMSKSGRNRKGKRKKNKKQVLYN
jgi:hypothetical protein